MKTPAASRAKNDGTGEALDCRDEQAEAERRVPLFVRRAALFPRRWHRSSPSVGRLVCCVFIGGQRRSAWMCFNRMVKRAAVAAKLGIKTRAHMLRHPCGCE